MLGYLKQLKTREKVSYGVILAIVVLVVPLFCNAYLFVDDFDSYDLGNLAGQGGWILTDDHWEVQDFIKQSGNNAIYCASEKDCGAKKTGDQIPSGSIYFYMRSDKIGDTCAGWYIYLYGNPNEPDYPRIIASFDTAGKVNLIDEGNWVEVGILDTYNEFFPVELEWRDDTHDYRIRWEGKSWSNWYKWELYHWTYIDTIRFRKLSLERAGYIDTILSEAPPILQPQVWGISPNSGTEITDLNSILTIGYEDFGNYDSLYIALKHPQTGLFTNAKQYDISAIGQSGILTINLQNFNIEKNANWYLHAVATYEGYRYEDELFLSDYGWSWTGDLTDGSYYLDVNIEGFEEIFAMSDFNSWYAEYSKFDEPTEMFSAIVGVFSPIFSIIGEFGNRIKNYFDLNSAYSKGYEIGTAIPIFSYYTGQIAHFLGGFPIISWLLIVILILVGIFIFRIILKFIPFLGGS